MGAAMILRLLEWIGSGRIWGVFKSIAGKNNLGTDCQRTLSCLEEIAWNKSQMKKKHGLNTSKKMVYHFWSNWIAWAFRVSKLRGKINVATAVWHIGTSCSMHVTKKTRKKTLINLRSWEPKGPTPQCHPPQEIRPYWGTINHWFPLIRAY